MLDRNPVNSHPNGTSRRVRAGEATAFAVLERDEQARTTLRGRA